MKFLVISDIHVKRERLSEVDNIGNQALFYLQDCEGIIIPGDVFDVENPTPDEINWFIGFLKKIPLTKTIYLISGNHGKEKSGINATMWTPKIHPNLIHHESSLDVVINGKNVRIMHTSVAESKMGPEDYMLGGVSYKDIKKDILILGHIHKSQIISENPLVFHPGNPYYLNFGERNDKKGIYILDIDKEISCKFIPLKVIPMYQVEILDTELDKIEEKVKNIPQLAKVKYVFHVDTCNLETTTQIGEIVKTHKDRYHLFKFQLKIKQREMEINKNLKSNHEIENLLETFCEKEKVDDEIKNLLKGLLK